MNSARIIGFPYFKNENSLHSHTVHKSQCKWILDVNVQGKTTKLPENNTGEYLHDLGIGKE